MAPGKPPAGGTWSTSHLDPNLPMTRRAYSPDDFDELALRIFDLAASLRQMSLRCREHRLSLLPLHDKKAREWLDHLDDWVRKCATEVELAAVRHKAAQRADEVAARPSRASTAGVAGHSTASRIRKKRA